MRHPLVLLLALSLVSIAVSCDGPPSAGASALPRATIGEAGPLPPAVDGKVFALSPEKSSIGFVGRKVIGQHSGGFIRFNGEVRVGADVASSSVSVSIDLGSTVSDSEKLTGHLLSADFFDAATYKTATFTSTSVKPDGAAHLVTGVLFLHGVKKSISFPATIVIGADVVTVDARFTFDRKAFGITYPGKPDNLIQDDVELSLKIVAAPAAVVPKPTTPTTLTPTAPTTPTTPTAPTPTAPTTVPVPQIDVIQG